MKNLFFTRATEYFIYFCNCLETLGNEGISLFSLNLHLRVEFIPLLI